jgi:hypothetical protein
MKKIIDFIVKYAKLISEYAVKFANALSHFRRFGGAEISNLVLAVILGFIFPKVIAVPILALAIFLFIPILADAFRWTKSLFVKNEKKS